jgi:undecaprenyl-diphosphatase
MDWLIEVWTKVSMMLSTCDLEVLRAVHHHRIAALDKPLYYFSFFTTYISVSILLVVLVRSFIVVSPEAKRALRQVFLVLLAVLFSGAVLTFCLKRVVHRERPFVRHADIQKLSEGGSPSFPSGHTLEAFAMALACVRLFREQRALRVLFVWATLVGYSRMALGVHYPLDVVGGAGVGMIMSLGVLRLFEGMFAKVRVEERL